MPLWPEFSLGGTRSTSVEGLEVRCLQFGHITCPLGCLPLNVPTPLSTPSLRLGVLSRFAPSSWGQTSCVVKNVSESHPPREATPEACSSQSQLCPCPWLHFITLLVLPGWRLYSGITGSCPLSAFFPFASYNGLLATPTSPLLC